jgi:hypothetical protein
MHKIFKIFLLLTIWFRLSASDILSLVQPGNGNIAIPLVCASIGMAGIYIVDQFDLGKALKEKLPTLTKNEVPESTLHWVSKGKKAILMLCYTFTNYYIFACVTNNKYKGYFGAHPLIPMTIFYTDIWFGKESDLQEKYKKNKKLKREPLFRQPFHFTHMSVCQIGFCLNQAYLNNYSLFENWLLDGATKSIFCLISQALSLEIWKRSWNTWRIKLLNIVKPKISESQCNNCVNPFLCAVSYGINMAQVLLFNSILIFLFNRYFAHKIFI